MSNPNPVVVVLGGGVGGMSAAQELAERGFQVRVFEKKSVPGGKARSIPVPNSGTEGREDLPGEHGFRFFPRFYRHVTDSMKRIPFPGNERGVYDNLVEASRDMLAQFDKKPLVAPARFPRTLADVELMLSDMFDGADIGVDKADLSFFGERIWQLMTSCQQRIEEQYERISWWTFTDAAARSAAYRAVLVEGLTRTLVAAKANQASTRSGGVVLTEMVYATARPGRSDDNLLNGPTTERWIDPWLSYLQGSRGRVPPRRRGHGDRMPRWPDHGCADSREWRVPEGHRRLLRLGPPGGGHGPAREQGHRSRRSTSRHTRRPGEGMSPT